MLSKKVLCCLVVLSAMVSVAYGAGVPTPAPSFTISASNVTMPPSGSVAIPFTLTSVNGYAGEITVGCTAPTESAGVRAPYCYDGGPAHAYTLAANGTATGTIDILAIKPTVVPAVRAANISSRGQETTWAAAGVMLLGLGMRRKRVRRLARVSLTLGMFALAGLGLCGCSGPPTLTPGEYVFTLTAQSVSNGTLIPQMTQTTTATVTVPAGIVTDASNGH